MRQSFTLWTFLILIFLYMNLCNAQQAYLTVHSENQPAFVFEDSVQLGSTPLDSIPVTTGVHVLRFLNGNVKSWYVSSITETVSVVGGEHLVKTISFPSMPVNPVLSLMNNPGDNRMTDNIPFKALNGKQAPSEVPIYLTASATVLTGAVAAFFKVKADQYYDDFRRTGDQGALDKVKTHDTVSGIALAACEINLALLTYILLSR